MTQPSAKVNTRICLRLKQKAVRKLVAVTVAEDKY